MFVILCGVAALVRYRAEHGASAFVIRRQTEHEENMGNQNSPAKGSMSFMREDAGLEPDNGGGTEPGGKTGADAVLHEEPVTIYVHVCGAVVREGVYLLNGASRMVDAIEAAGGFAENADRSYYNLARLLADGQKIYVPTVEETEGMTLSEREISDNAQNPTEAGTSAEPGKKLNLNNATREELMTLPGIGATKAESIIKYRKKIGKFKTIEEITNVSGIGAALFEQIREQISAE